jgi:HEAT repeat protein
MRRTLRFIELARALVLLAAVAAASPSAAAEMPKDPDRLSPAKAVDAWLAVVEDTDQSHLRRNYAEGRIVLLGKVALPRLLELWRDASEDRRGTIAEILGMTTDLPPEGVQVLTDEVKKRGFRVHPHVVRALADRNAVEAVPLMLEALPNAPDELRLATLHALGRLADERAADVLVASLDHPDRLIRTTAADGLTRLLTALRVATDAKRKDAYRPLFRRTLDYAEKGATFESRRILAGGMGLVGDPDATGLLRRLLRFETVEMRIAAAGSLGRLQAHEAVGDLAEAARSEDPLLRRTALDALASIGDESCIPTLVELLETSAPKERRDVLRALRQIARQPFGDNPQQWHQWWEERKVAAPLLSS